MNIIKKRLFYFSLAILLLLGACGSNNTKSDIILNDSLTNKIPKELSLINSEIDKNPENPDLYNKRAKYFYSIKNFDAGLQDAEKAILIDSTKAEYYLTISNFYFSANKTGMAKGALEKCISLDSQNVDALLKLAELYLYVAKYEKSIEFINKVLKIDMYNAPGYFMKGMCFKEMKDTVRAISSMQTAVEQDKDYYHAYMQLGLLCAAKKNKLAVEYYNNAIRIQPKSKETFYALGKFYQDMGNWDNSITTYSELVKFDPTNKFAFHNMGVVYLTGLKLNEKALESFTTATKIDPKYVEAYYGRALVYQTIGDKKNARADFESCLAINPNYMAAQEALKKLGK